MSGAPRAGRDRIRSCGLGKTRLEMPAGGFDHRRHCRLCNTSVSGHVDRSTGAAASIHLRDYGAAHCDSGRAGDCADAHRYLPRYRYPGGQRHLELRRRLAGRDGGNHHGPLRALLHHLGQRYRAYGIGIAAGARRSSASSSIRRRAWMRRWRNWPPRRSRCCIRCPRALRRPAFSASTHPASPFCNWESPATRCLSRHSMTWATSPSARRWRTCRARCSRCPTAASRARFRWTWNPQALLRAGALGLRRGARHQLAER